MISSPAVRSTAACAEVDVADVGGVEVAHEQPAVPLAAQQTLLDEPLHRLAQRPAAHAEARGQLHLAQLCARREVPRT